ncbi:MAG: MerR family transcriptional regulator [bacterium]|nr:MerR family transcriptional regulator [bacterium]
MSEEKIFYSISEVSEQTDLPKSVLRFWETEFSEINPDRRQGRRYFRQSDIDLILKIKDLLYKKGFTIKGAKKFLHDDKKNSVASGKIYSDFEMNEKKQSLEPVQESKILKRFNFSAPLSDTDDNKAELSEMLQRLEDIQKILEE